MPVGVRGIYVQRADIGAHPEWFALNAHVLTPLEKQTPQRADGLIADEKDRRLRLPEEALEMMTHAARVAHAARGQDDVPAAESLDIAAFVRRFGEAQPTALAQAREGISCDRAAALFQKDIAGADGQRAVQKDRTRRRPVGLDEIQQIDQYLLCPLDGERGDEEGTASGVRGGNL